MRNLGKAKYKSILIVAITIFSLNATAVPTSAIDLGAKGKYIISVKPAARAAIEAAITKAGGKLSNKYSYVFDGYTVELPKLVASLLSRIPDVLTVEEDLPVSGFNIQNIQSPTPSWGLDRIDQRTQVGLPGSVNAFGYASAGRGATIYIGDTGIYPHNEFGSRLSTSGYSSISDGNGTVDCNGHGTHVASTAAGTQYGIAKNATLVPVRILDCSGSGSYSGVIAGLDWILSPSNPNAKSAAVLNLSIGGGKSEALNSAIQRLTNAGVVVVAAAGNDNTDACLKSPASAPTAITVGATMINDSKSSYSNYGSCVDINAPGSIITGAWFGSATATNTISGTSMATPHVTGAAAVYLGLHPTASVSETTAFLDSESTKNVVTNLPAGTPNKLLFVSPTDGGAPIVAPTVAMKNIENITHQSADININVNPGYAPTTLSFEYSADSSFTTFQSAVVNPSSVDGGAQTTATVKLTNLSSTTKYYFRIIGTNESGRTVSEIGNFTTLAPPVTKPTAVANQATDVTSYSARLSGSVQAGNALATINFLYSTDQTFTSNVNSIAAKPFQFSGNTATNVALDITFLDGEKTYYYKIVAVNSSGTASSNVLSFTTPKAPGLAPTAITYVTPVSRSIGTAEFAGKVNPMSQTTVVKFAWGYEKSLTVGQQTITIPQSPITGDTEVAVTAKPTGLTPGKGVYFQFIASNASGITKSVIQYAIMSPEIPVINSVSSSLINSSGAKLSGVFNAMGSNTRVYFDFTTASAFDTGVVSVQATPWAVANAVTTTLTATLTGLTAGTKYFWRLRVAPAGSSDWKDILSATQNFTTSTVAPTPTPISSSYRSKTRKE